MTAEIRGGPHYWFPCTELDCSRKVAVSRAIYEHDPTQFPPGTHLPCPVHGSIPYEQHERLILAVIAERDEAQDWADRLAEALAAGRDIGEHSNLNNPWERALELAQERPEPPAPFSWVNEHYGLDVKKGTEFLFCGKKGVVVEDHGNYLGVRLYSGGTGVVSIHPTWSVVYLDDETGLPR